MVNLESYDSPQIKLIQEFDRGFLARDANILAKPLHDNFRHIVYPRSLGVPAANKEEWLRSMNYVLNSPIRFSDSVYHSVVETPGKVILHSTHRLEGLTEIDAAGRESIWIIEIITDEDGSLKIKQVEQFTDSRSYKDLFQASAAAEK